MNATLFQNLRKLFIVGNAATLALLFAPSNRVSTVSGQILMSDFEMIKLLPQTGNFFLFLFIIVIGVASPIAWIVLGVTYPKRWVFITGASLGAFFLLMSFFSGDGPVVEQVFIWEILEYFVALLVMVGFAIKPPQGQGACVSSGVCPKCGHKNPSEDAFCVECGERI